MNGQQIERIGKYGWKVGNASDFLELSPEESSYVEIRLALASELKARRKRNRLTQIELAGRLQSSQARVARMESGAPGVSIDLLIRSLLALGTSRRELAALVESGCRT